MRCSVFKDYESIDNALTAHTHATGPHRHLTRLLLLLLHLALLLGCPLLRQLRFTALLLQTFLFLGFALGFPAFLLFKLFAHVVGFRVSTEKSFRIFQSSCHILIRSITVAQFALVPLIILLLFRVQGCELFMQTVYGFMQAFDLGLQFLVVGNKNAFFRQGFFLPFNNGLGNFHPSLEVEHGCLRD